MLVAATVRPTAHRVGKADDSCLCALVLSPVPAANAMPTTPHCSSQSSERVKLSEGARRLLEIDDWSRSLSSLIRMSRSITGGRHIRQRTIERCVEQVLFATDDLLRDAAAVLPMDEVPEARPLGSSLEAFWLRPLHDAALFLCLLRNRVAPLLPRDVWEGVVLQALEIPADPPSRSGPGGPLGAVSTHRVSCPSHRLVRRFGFDANGALRVSLAAPLEPPARLGDDEAALLAARHLLPEYLHKKVFRLARAVDEVRSTKPRDTGLFFCGSLDA